jgi:hypothetical protein
VPKIARSMVPTTAAAESAREPAANALPIPKIARCDVRHPIDGSGGPFPRARNFAPADNGHWRCHRTQALDPLHPPNVQHLAILVVVNVVDGHQGGGGVNNRALHHIARQRRGPRGRLAARVCERERRNMI